MQDSKASPTLRRGEGSRDGKVETYRDKMACSASPETVLICKELLGLHVLHVPVCVSCVRFTLVLTTLFD